MSCGVGSRWDSDLSCCGSDSTPAWELTYAVGVALKSKKKRKKKKRKKLTVLNCRVCLGLDVTNSVDLLVLRAEHIRHPASQLSLHSSPSGGRWFCSYKAPTGCYAVSETATTLEAPWVSVILGTSIFWLISWTTRKPLRSSSLLSVPERCVPTWQKIKAVFTS